MTQYHGGPHHGRTVSAPVGKRPTKPHNEPLIVEGTRFLHAVSEDGLTAAIYVATRGKLVYEGDRRFTAPYPSTVTPELWPRFLKHVARMTTGGGGL